MSALPASEHGVSPSPPSLPSIPLAAELPSVQAHSPSQPVGASVDVAHPVTDAGGFSHPVTTKDVGELFAALSELQAGMVDPSPGGVNETLGTRHLTLAGVLSAARPLLKANGLCIVQMPAGAYLRTILGHKSGQFIQCDTPLLMARSDLVPMQALASAVSFARRIAATSVLGVAQPDDDGQSTGLVTGVDTDLRPGATRPSLGLVAGALPEGTPATAVKRGFSVAATIEAIKSKSTHAELDDAKTRVEAVFRDADLKEVLDAIEDRRKALAPAAS